MSYANRVSVSVTTDASGNATVFSEAVTGKISSIQYVKTDFADGVDFTITSEASGESLWTQSDVNAAAIVRPRAPTHSQAGVAALYASGGVAVLDKIAVANDRVKIVIGSGGNAKSGKFYIVLE
jgi:hypothetical protein